MCGGQAGTRERTVDTCIIYLPRYQKDTTLPTVGTNVDDLRREFTDEHYREGVKLSEVEELFVEFQARYIGPRVQELALFQEFALKYAVLDGWNVEALPEIEVIQKRKGKGSSQEKSVTPWGLLPDGLKLVVGQLHGESNLYKIKEAEKEAKQGSVGADLLAENRSELVQLLVESRLAELCDGNAWTRDDQLVAECAAKLSEPKSIEILNRSSLLTTRLGRGKRDQTEEEELKARWKTLGTVVKCLGGMATPTGDGRKKRIFELPEPPKPCG